MLDAKAFDTLATKTLDRIVRVIDDEVDPDVVEAVPSMGVVTLDFGDARRKWIVNSQSAAVQIWLAAEQRAWHFSHEGKDQDDPVWIAPKTSEELFATLSGLLKEQLGLSITF
ncbi:MAG: iron donor protein CyaY [Planctomycetes bacterium]|nr:iron donor protein CyaY [Planctomycetota bacterium]